MNVTLSSGAWGELSAHEYRLGSSGRPCHGVGMPWQGQSPLSPLRTGRRLDAGAWAAQRRQRGTRVSVARGRSPSLSGHLIASGLANRGLSTRPVSRESARHGCLAELCLRAEQRGWVVLDGRAAEVKRRPHLRQARRPIHSRRSRLWARASQNPGDPTVTVPRCHGHSGTRYRPTQRRGPAPEPPGRPPPTPRHPRSPGSRRSPSCSNSARP
jgi:hypothetical protein